MPRATATTSGPPAVGRLAGRCPATGLGGGVFDCSVVTRTPAAASPARVSTARALEAARRKARRRLRIEGPFASCRIEVVMTLPFRSALLGVGHANHRRGDAICSPRSHGRVRADRDPCAGGAHGGSTSPVIPDCFAARRAWRTSESGLPLRTLPAGSVWGLGHGPVPLP